jgi:hypothetical protein
MRKIRGNEQIMEGTITSSELSSKMVDPTKITLFADGIVSYYSGDDTGFSTCLENIANVAASYATIYLPGITLKSSNELPSANIVVIGVHPMNHIYAPVGTFINNKTILGAGMYVFENIYFDDGANSDGCIEISNTIPMESGVFTANHCYFRTDSSSEVFKSTVTPVEIYLYNCVISAWSYLINDTSGLINILTAESCVLDGDINTIYPNRVKISNCTIAEAHIANYQENTWVTPSTQGSFFVDGIFHSSDIYWNGLTRHLPLPSYSGLVPVSNGSPLRWSNENKARRSVKIVSSGVYTLNAHDSMVVCSGIGIVVHPPENPELEVIAIGDTYSISSELGAVSVSCEDGSTINGETSQTIYAHETMCMTYYKDYSWIVV